MKKIISFATSIAMVLTLFAVIPTVRAQGVEVETGIYHLINVATGHYLSLSGNKNTQGTNIRIEAEVTDAVNQVFKIKAGDDNTYKIQPAESTDKFIGTETVSADNVNVSLRNQSDKNTQGWRFEKAGDGIYTIRSAGNHSIALAGSSVADKANVVLKNFDETDLKQQWKLVKFTLRKEGDDPKILSYGIDVSKWQGDINWNAVKEYGVEFAVIRIGYSEVKDPYFEKNYQAAIKAGLKVGVYLYSYNVTVAEAKRDAKDVLEWLNGRRLELPVFYDIEDEKYQGGLTTKLRTDMAVAFMQGIKSGGYQTGVYAGEYWLNNKLNLTELRKHGEIWMAKWPTSDQADQDNSAYELWQFRSDGKIAGISGDVDVNVAYKTYCSHDGGTTAVTTKATVTQNGSVVKKCKLCSNQVTKTTLYKASSIKFTESVLYYNGKVRTPPVVVKTSAGKTLKKNTDYTVSYSSGRKYVGKYKAVIKFKGNYSGTKTLYFTINPPKTTVKTVTSPAKRCMRVYINRKVGQVTGYQIQYSVYPSFKKYKYVTLKSYKYSYKTFTGLYSGKYYYARIRTYKTVNGKNYYSAWSAYKKVKTK